MSALLRNRRPARAARALVACLFVVLACNEDPPQVTHLAQHDFEGRCGDEPLACGWVQIAGPDGQARYGSAFHPSDHALVLEGSGVGVRGPGGDSRAATLTLGSLRLDMGVRCDPGNVLSVSVGIVDASSATPTFSDELIGTVRPSRRWEDGRAGTTLTARTALSEGGLGMRPPYTVRVSSITITKTGPGRCEISDLALDDSAGFSVPVIGCSS